MRVEHRKIGIHVYPFDRWWQPATVDACHWRSVWTGRNCMAQISEYNMSGSFADEFEALDSLVSNIAEKLPRIRLPWLKESHQELKESDMGESCVDKNNDREEPQTQVVDVNQFYILKKDTERRKRTQISKRDTQIKEMEITSGGDFISFGSESNESDQEDSDVDSLSKSTKRKYEEKRTKDMIKEKPKFECAKVIRLKGNPNKVKKKKKKNKLK